MDISAIRELSSYVDADLFDVDLCSLIENIDLLILALPS